uniref:Uncharacterized protein n=1 Tax=Chaetoceros debilis TaxID=122233 RepID=A0A6S8T8B6_9STRA
MCYPPSSSTPKSHPRTMLSSQPLIALSKRVHEISFPIANLKEAEASFWTRLWKFRRAVKFVFGMALFIDLPLATDRRIDAAIYPCIIVSKALGRISCNPLYFGRVAN